MKSPKILLMVGVMLFAASTVSYAQNKSKKKADAPKVEHCDGDCCKANSYGYYKDVFMDSGINVTSRRDLPATRFLGLSMEAFVSASHSPNKLTLRDTVIQNEMICGSADDLNGILLYPDGEPRFRMIYMNGGKATKHGNSLTPKGRANIQQFLANGGSYVGTCAGMFIASLGVYKKDSEFKPNDSYMALWEGTTHSSGLGANYTAMKVIKNSPLLKYYDFGGDMRIDSVYHNGGGFAYYGEGCIIPEGTEPLLKYIYDTVGKDVKARQIHDQVSAWAYKKSDESGRLVITGSHPEGVAVGERLEYMAAMMRYAMDGNGRPTIKGELVDGQLREMNKKTSDNEPLYTRIGDRQYHHFTVTIPKDAKRAVIYLKGYKDEDDFDLTLCAKEGGYAFAHNTECKNVARGCEKKLVVNAPAEGVLYVSVFCETTVESHFGKYGTEYKGRTDVLNGVPYSIKVEIE